MTVDLSVAPAQVESTCRRQVCTYTGPTLYVAGGDALTPADFRMGKVFAVLGGYITNGSAVLLVTFVASTSKLYLTTVSSGSEFSGDASGYSGQLEVVGQ